MKKVLIIDDEPSIVRFCERVFQGIGLEIETVDDGNKAEDLVLQSDAEYDLILTDIRLPHVSGIEIYTMLLQEKPVLAERVMFMTGSVMGLETRRFLDTCGQPYLLKPFRPEQLITAVQEFLDLSS